MPDSVPKPAALSSRRAAILFSNTPRRGRCPLLFQIAGKGCDQLHAALFVKVDDPLHPAPAASSGWFVPHVVPIPRSAATNARKVNIQFRGTSRDVHQFRSHGSRHPMTVCMVSQDISSLRSGPCQMAVRADLIALEPNVHLHMSSRWFLTPPLSSLTFDRNGSHHKTPWECNGKQPNCSGATSQASTI